MRIALILVLFIGILGISACEKDDICVDADTPLLVIRFYDKDDTTLVKEVPSLIVNGLIGTEAQGVISNASLDSIAIPLRIGEGSTSFTLSQNPDSDDETTLNVDTVTFDYETKELFVSRACGYIANYDALTGTLATDAAPWISEIRIVTPLIENSSSAHVKILH